MFTCIEKNDLELPPLTDRWRCRSSAMISKRRIYVYKQILYNVGVGAANNGPALFGGSGPAGGRLALPPLGRGSLSDVCILMETVLSISSDEIEWLTGGGRHHPSVWGLAQVLHSELACAMYLEDGRSFRRRHKNRHVYHPIGKSARSGEEHLAVLVQHHELVSKVANS
ncbi:hypothetical protein EVAR_10009_1 [Eumeta japonica]|uniref:Uncharacterized protein n=1 Tax=Eumeta variegata TaxID=151549 RepID=A0A4C1TR30_EUMVA|nr:hypothetical protein EVAR_10009_1 [Eumeta japonica]